MGGERGAGGTRRTAMVRMIEDEEDWEATINGDKTVVVDFTAQWCGPCRMIGPKFEEFSLTYTDLLFVKVDVDDCDSVAAKAGISAMPTFQVYKARRGPRSAFFLLLRFYSAPPAGIGQMLFLRG